MILVIQIHSRNESTYQKASLRRRSMRISKYQKVWAWLNGPRKAPLGDHDKITNRLSSRCVSHKWRWSCNSMKIYKSQRNGNVPQYGIRCMVDKKIRQHRIIHHQMCNPNHPYPQLNWVQTSKRHLPEEETWWYLNINQISNTCPSRACRRWNLIPWP